MPNLTVPVVANLPPVVALIIGPTSVAAEAALAAGEFEWASLLTVPVMLDTGSELSMISRRLAEELGLDPGGERSVLGVGASAPEVGLIYRIRLMFPGIPSVLLASNAKVVAVEDLDRFDVGMIMGRDLLSRCILIYNGPDSCCTFAF
ncbi:aspartyl protease family protein [Singulisphaera sp. Ch08]|uniref:Aspartyl protease family protein n=1 Tax=Singulisphaera sp. Ch08 TaxID=3120278 RepID=A0AAU7C9N0_9BACT